MKFKGQVAVVTGGGRNIGKDIAMALAKEGATVVITGLNQTRGSAAAEEMGNDSCFIMADVSSENDRQNLVKTVMDRYGRLDILVNNAGILYHTNLDTMTEDTWDRTMDINLKGMAFLTREVAKIMKKAGYGRIINISSMLSEVHYYDTSEYAISKAGVKSLTEQAAVEYAKYGITVNALAPGYIYTDMTREELSQPMLAAKICKRIPVRRMGETVDICSSVVFFAGDDASYITGQTICIDGGYTLI